MCPNEIPNAKIQLRLLSEINENFDIIADLSQKVRDKKICSKNNFPFKVLMTLYQLDLIEGEVILHWYHKSAIDQELKSAIKKFIDYLEESSEEESDSE